MVIMIIVIAFDVGASLEFEDEATKRFVSDTDPARVMMKRVISVLSTTVGSPAMHGSTYICMYSVCTSRGWYLVPSKHVPLPCAAGLM